MNDISLKKDNQIHYLDSKLLLLLHNIEEKMKDIRLLFAGLMVLACCLQSCNNGKTYAEMKEEEADAVNAWILSHDYKIISEKEFYAQDTMTNENEFVLFDETGVYMNIMCKGPKNANGEYRGHVLKDGSYEILSRFVEIAMQTRDTPQMEVGDTILANMKLYGMPSMELFPEDYKLTISGSSYSAAFQSYRQYSMYGMYSTTSVPSGWLLPLKYLKPARTQSMDDVARVRILVPHGQGTSTASKYVYPCYYELTYNIGK